MRWSPIREESVILGRVYGNALALFYRLADEDVFQLCDLMRGRLAREMDARSRLPDPWP